MSWSEAQRRMVALGIYSGRIDNDPGGDGSQTLNGVFRLLDMAEKAAGVTPPKALEVLPVVVGNFALPGNFDPDYRWIGTIGTLPRVLQEAIMLFGTAEITGRQHNTTILSWAKEAGLEAVYTNDEIAWCGLFVAVTVKRAGYAPVAGPLWALNWLKFGVKGETAKLGDILCFQREGGGHVGFYVGEDAEFYHVLGGNQSNRVSIVRVAKNRCKGIRRPAYKNPLPAWKPYHLTTGGAVSRNEA